MYIYLYKYTKHDSNKIHLYDFELINPFNES